MQSVAGVVISRGGCCPTDSGTSAIFSLRNELLLSGQTGMRFSSSFSRFLCVCFFFNNHYNLIRGPASFIMWRFVLVAERMPHLIFKRLTIVGVCLCSLSLSFFLMFDAKPTLKLECNYAQVLSDDLNINFC